MAASDSDCSAAVLQMAVVSRQVAPASSALLRQEVYPPSCILPDISQVIAQPSSAVRTCSSKASCGSAAVHRPPAGGIAIGSCGRAVGRDVAVPSCDALKAPNFPACSSAGGASHGVPPDGPAPGNCAVNSYETNSCTDRCAVGDAHVSGGGMSSQQSQSERVHGTQSALTVSAANDCRGTVRSRSQLPCQSSSHVAVQDAVAGQPAGETSPRPRKVRVLGQSELYTRKMDCV